MDVGGEVDERMDAEETIEATSGSSSMAMEEFFFLDDYASAFFSIMADFTVPGALWFAAFAANIQTAVTRYACENPNPNSYSNYEQFHASTEHAECGRFYGRGVYP